MRKNCNNACKLVEFLADTERILTYFSESIISDNYSGLYNELEWALSNQAWKCKKLYLGQWWKLSLLFNLL